MSTSRHRSSGVLVLLGLVAMCVVLWRLRGAIEPEPPETGATTQAATATPAVAASVVSGVPPPSFPPPQPSIPESPLPDVPELAGGDASDSCRPLYEATIPPDYESVTIDGVTVAWQPGPPVKPTPNYVALQPTAVAYLVKGLLTEAAALTGTARREQMTVIVYPSPELMHSATRAPAWAGGAYNGANISLAAGSGVELGVQVSSLRHELMHAQLHAAVGCMPAWFNEGLAMYFSGRPPIRAWLRMLRNPDTYDLDSLRVPSFVSLPRERAERAYAESLAMIIYVLDRTGEIGLRSAVHTLRALGRKSPRGGLDLWDRLSPGVGHRGVLDALAHKMFGVSLGRELDAMFQGVLCCHGLRSVSELGCRSLPPRPDTTYWIDDTTSPSALCETSWLN